MDTITLTDVIDGMSTVIDTVVENEAYFSELDSAAGDGDFGSSLAKGFRELRARWEQLDRTDIGAFMKSCSATIMETCGGASGPIWGTAFRRAGRYANEKGSLDLQEASELVQAMVEGVQRVGGAALGDKTLLDALIPAAEALSNGALANEEMAVALRKCVDAAEGGAEKTKEISAKKGRASYVGDRSIGHYDAGAKAVAVILRRVVEGWLS